MTRTTRLTRLVTLAVLLLSQLTAGLMVVCDEGLGGQFMEFVLEACCDEVAGAEDTCDTDADCVESSHGACGPCVDAPVIVLLQKEEDQRTPVLVAQVSPVEFGVALFASPCQRITARYDSCRGGVRGTVTEFARTVVLTC